MMNASHTSARALGRFISFEGLDGCGKSTQMRALAQALGALGISVVSTREPGGSLFGESIRALLLEGQHFNIDARAELALLFAGRAQLVADVIRPALAEGKWVLCDRFIDSSEAYQGSGRRLGSEVVRTMHSILNGGLMPDLTVILRNPVDLSLARARARTPHKEADRFEREDKAFFVRVQRGFDQIAARDTARVVMLDASQSEQAIHNRVRSLVAERFAGKLSGVLTKADRQLI